jgi:hypothetical protein
MEGTDIQWGFMRVFIAAGPFKKNTTPKYTLSVDENFFQKKNKQGQQASKYQWAQ